MLRQFSGTCKYTLNIINRGKKIINFPLKFGRKKYAWIVTFSKRNLDENKKIKEKLERSEGYGVAVRNKRSNTNRIGWQLVIGPVGREFECIWHSAVVTSNGFTVT